ncbi:unnamed protein product [Urochloa humidicola]
MTATAAEASTPSRCLNDNVVDEILLRLPSSDVLHCRAVCKAWRRITNSPLFLAAYSRRRCPLELIVPHRGVKGELVLDTIPLFLKPDEARRRRRCLQAPRRRGYSLIGSCDGLLLFEAGPGSDHFVCNPVTKQWTMLPGCDPAGDSVMVCGFYLHRPSGEHRLLYLTTDQHASHYVYSLEAAEARRLEQAFPADVFCFKRPFDCLNYRGKLHWQQHPLVLFSYNVQHRFVEDTSKIVAFDTESETFRRISLPRLSNRHPEPEERLCLTEMDGKLAMAAIEEGSMDLWVLEDYNDDGTWTRRLRVDLPHPWFVPLNAGVQLVQNAIFLEDCWNHSVWLYDLKEKRMLEQIQFDGQPPGVVYSICLNALDFRESLKRHAFFDRQNPK